MSSRVDLLGRTFGRLTVLRYEGLDKHNKAWWYCKCSCGVEKSFCGSRLTNGAIRSCGCLKKARLSAMYTKHGQARNALMKTPEYKTWIGMKTRCFNTKSKDWPLYGGRGVTICKEWRDSFEAFFSYVGKKPSPDMSIDRYPDTNGNYEPGNVRWATPLDQVHNRRPTTHCKNGHPLTDENSYIDKRYGGRTCKTCRKETRREYEKHRPKRDYAAERSRRQNTIERIVK